VTARDRLLLVECDGWMALAGSEEAAVSPRPEEIAQA
jgi:hypothetical protein